MGNFINPDALKEAEEIVFSHSKNAFNHNEICFNNISLKGENI